MKLRMLLCGIIFLFVGAYLHPVFAEEITSFDTHLDIQSDGALQVKEQIEYDFGSAYRHGIYRTIPFTKVNSKGQTYVMNIGGFSVADQASVPYTYDVSTEQQSKKIKIGDADKTITGPHTYAISYTVGGALTYFSDHDELYWNVTGDQWAYPIKDATAEISLPSNVAPSDIRMSCFVGHSGSKEASCSTSYDHGIAKITSNRPLAPNEQLTIVFGFPKNIVGVLEPTLYVSFWDTLVGKIVLILLVVLSALWYVVLPISIPITWWKHGRDPKSVMGAASAWFDAPKTKDGKPLTPGETGTLVDEKADMRDITATIVHLAQRGFIQIIEAEKGSFTLKKLQPKEPSELRTHEKRLYNDIFGALDVVNLKTANLAIVVEQAKKDLYDMVVIDGFFEKNPQSVRNGYIALAVLGLVTGNFPLLLSSLLFGLQMPVKTVYGSETAAIAQSLKNFLTSQQRQLAFQAKNQMMFEKLLPYAVAFGVEKIWAERFSDIAMKQPDWYQGYSTSHFNSVLFVNSLSRSTASFATAATPVSSSTGHSSGFSGGFSGGGGGGGGGGSW